MTIEYEQVISGYNTLFEGINTPVFYYDLYPTSLLENPTQWSRYRFGQGLKYNANIYSENHKRWYDENYRKYQQVVENFLNCLLNSNEFKRFGILTIPASDKEIKNCITEIVQKVLSRNASYEGKIVDLTDNLKRSKNKNSSHEHGNRSQAENIETLEIVDDNILKTVDAIIIIDDIVTTGSSFNAVQKKIDETDYFGDIINFSLSRSMNEAAHYNYDNWMNRRNDKSKENIEKHGKVDAIIFDFDQTLIDTSQRNDFFESKISQVDFSFPQDIDKIHYKKYIEDHDDLYLPYESKKMREFQKGNIPFAILSNSWNKRLKILHQFSEIQKAVYPYTYDSHTHANENNLEIHELYTADKSSNYMYNGCSWRYTYNLPKNIFSAPKKTTEEKYISFSKPSHCGVESAKKWLVDTFDLTNDSRIIGVGNTMEDIIAYNSSGIESVLALWGIPKLLVNYAKQHWGADYSFESFHDFSNWISKQ